MKNAVIGIKKITSSIEDKPKKIVIFSLNKMNRHMKINKNENKKKKEVVTIFHASSLFLGIKIANSNLPEATIAKMLLEAKKIAYAPISSGV